MCEYCAVLVCQQNILIHRFINAFIQPSIFVAVLLKMRAHNGCHSRIVKEIQNDLLILSLQTSFFCIHRTLPLQQRKTHVIEVCSKRLVAVLLHIQHPTFILKLESLVFVIV